MNKAIQLTVNGRSVSGAVEPRLQLADFLREHLMLTGTHLGCEHGVCGACTVELDGAPARSCIAYAVACNGADVRTIEGFDDDALMAELREAFSAEHALQCGYCTPGMLVTARDIVMRLPRADEARIRKELAGNLCRCTGYVGIVRAIQRVLADRKERGVPGPEAVRPAFDSAALRSGRMEPVSAADVTPVRPERTPVAPKSKDARLTTAAQPSLHQSFTVDHPRDKVWALFGRLDEVTTCLPGASIIGTPTDDHVDVKLRVKLGPIAPEFEGGADVERDPADYSGIIRGSARDTRSSSATRGEIRYALIEENGATATRVDLDVHYTLTGSLAQFSRSGFVKEIAATMTKQFAANLRARLEGSAAGRAETAQVNGLSLLWSAIRARVRRLFRL